VYGISAYALDQGWAINLARRPLWEGRIQRRAVPSNGNRSKFWLS